MWNTPFQSILILLSHDVEHPIPVNLNLAEPIMTADQQLVRDISYQELQTMSLPLVLHLN